MKCADFLKVIICILIWTSGIASKNLAQKYFKEKEKEISLHLSLGNYYNALKVCDDLIQSKNLDKNQKYQLLTTKSKIHFWDENLNEFMRSASEAYRLKSNDKKIFRAYYYAQKAAYFHYFIVGDSAVMYSDKSLQIVKENRKDLDLIAAHFIYQIYGTTFLYRPKTFNNITQIELGERICQDISNYMDSAKYYIKNSNFFPQEKALIHRSMGNRLMDVANYKIRHHKADFTNYSIQMKYANDAIKEYEKGLIYLPKQEANFRRSLLALKALAYYCSNRQNKGNEILWPMIKNMSTDPEKFMLKSMTSSLYAVQYFTQNILSQKKYDPRIESVIKIYKKIRPWWIVHIGAKLKISKDSYGNSPSTMLTAINYWFQEVADKNYLSNKEILTMAIDNYYYFNNSVKRVFDFPLFKRILCQVEKNKSISSECKSFLSKFKFPGAFKIQSKLKRNEAILLKMEGALNNTFMILCTKNQIKINHFPRFPVFDNLLEVRDLNVFKDKAYENFLKLPFNKFFKNSKSIDKVYVAGDLDVPFDFMLLDKTGDFSTLNYFERKFNVIKMYNVFDFFQDENNSKTILNKLYVNKLTKKKSQVPFTENFLKEIKLNKVYVHSFNPSLFQKEGIIHLFGHTSLIENNQKYLKVTSLQQREQKMNKNYEIKTSLFVLNTCFAAYSRGLFFPDRDFQNNLISRGAKGVIASPFETVDQSSAYIFKQFYNYIFNGKTVEDALQLAKLDYLKTHKGTLAHPMYWSTYELTSNLKDLRMKLEVKEHGNNHYLFLLLFATLFLITIIFLRLLIEKFI
jgi:hypothetical protein